MSCDKVFEFPQQVYDMDELLILDREILLWIGNYIQFGVTHRLNGDIIYLQGFWVLFSFGTVLTIGRCL
jgi:hypothetical protein